MFEVFQITKTLFLNNIHVYTKLIINFNKILEALLFIHNQNFFEQNVLNYLKLSSYRFVARTSVSNVDIYIGIVFDFFIIKIEKHYIYNMIICNKSRILANLKLKVALNMS